MDHHITRRLLGLGLFIVAAAALGTALIQAADDAARRSVIVGTLVFVPTLVVVYAAVDVYLHDRPPKWMQSRKGFRLVMVGAWLAMLVSASYLVLRDAYTPHRMGVVLALAGMNFAGVLAGLFLLSARDAFGVTGGGGDERERKPTSAEAKNPDYAAVIGELDSSIARLRRLSRQIFALAAGALLAAILMTTTLSWHAVDLIKENSDNWTLFAFELVRTTAVATVLATAVWGTLNLGRAALDQAARHEKRLIAAHFLHFVMVEYESLIKAGDLPLPDVMAFMKSWNENVESAFTSVKYGKTRNDGTYINVGKDGVSYGEGQRPQMGKPA